MGAEAATLALARFACQMLRVKQNDEDAEVKALIATAMKVCAQMSTRGCMCDLMQQKPRVIMVLTRTPQMSGDGEGDDGNENKGENDGETDEKNEGEGVEVAEADEADEEDEEHEEEGDKQDERLQWTYDIKYTRGPPKNKVVAAMCYFYFGFHA